MIQRDLHARLVELARHYPVVTVTGPRQSGKTTLCRAAFPEHPYASLEDPGTRALALADPRGFLAQFPDGAILDEVQRAPDLLSYLQGIVDDRRRRGPWILTGSQHFGMLHNVTQSLAGRTAVLYLLPLSLTELRRFPGAPRELFEVLFAGGYPRIHDQGIPPAQWLADYVATYVERDVRQVLNVGDLVSFQTFMNLCAGRAGQLVNLASLGADAGISHPTVKAWLSVLEASFVVFRLPPLHRNIRKRLVKTPKLYFYDSGLLCYLLGIRSPDQILQHPLRGAIFESWVVSEVAKLRMHHGLTPNLFFYRDRAGTEIDLVLERGDATVAVEIKSGSTIFPDAFAALDTVGPLLAHSKGSSGLVKVAVYGGDQEHRWRDVRVLPWSGLGSFDWAAMPRSKRR